MEQRRAADFAHYNPIIQVIVVYFIMLSPSRTLLAWSTLYFSVLCRWRALLYFHKN